MLKNKLNIDNPIELASYEERISKKKAVLLFKNNMLENFKAGKFTTLQFIHRFLFEDIYDFAGQIRSVNIAKGTFRFTSCIYLKEALQSIDNMPKANFDENLRRSLRVCQRQSKQPCLPRPLGLHENRQNHRNP